MPNTKQPEQNKTWIEKWNNETFLDCNDDVVDDEYLLDQIKDFITNLLKEQEIKNSKRNEERDNVYADMGEELRKIAVEEILERVNKKVIGNNYSKSNCPKIYTDYNDVNYLKGLQRQKLDLIKGEI